MCYNDALFELSSSLYRNFAVLKSIKIIINFMHTVVKLKSNK